MTLRICLTDNDCGYTRHRAALEVPDSDEVGIEKIQVQHTSHLRYE